jgi:hypothetical protein
MPVRWAAQMLPLAARVLQCSLAPLVTALEEGLDRGGWPAMRLMAAPGRAGGRLVEGRVMVMVAHLLKHPERLDQPDSWCRRGGSRYNPHR